MRINPDKELILFAHVYDKGLSKSESEERRLEMRELIRSSTGVLVAEVDAPVEEKTAKYYIGKGKVEELRREADRAKAVTFVFGVDLTPSQTRNLEQEFLRTVIDRTGLILDIFARRAKTREGKLQVELAQNMYLLPRLEGRGVFLSKLGGGVGTRGPGEQKLEVDRRKIRQRITRLKVELKDLSEHRARLRQHRERRQFVRAVLVGYTNAGKSALLNSMIGKPLV
ncbi:MAG: GTPase HflX [Candidatus Omnitrophica bacterium]|nr:GTPase HflX [Candidatus Omnitrophota bacterium]